MSKKAPFQFNLAPCCRPFFDEGGRGGGTRMRGGTWFLLSKKIGFSELNMGYPKKIGFFQIFVRKSGGTPVFFRKSIFLIKIWKNIKSFEKNLRIFGGYTQFLRKIRKKYGVPKILLSINRVEKRPKTGGLDWTEKGPNKWISSIEKFHERSLGMSQRVFRNILKNCYLFQICCLVMSQVRFGIFWNITSRRNISKYDKRVRPKLKMQYSKNFRKVCSEGEKSWTKRYTFIS